MARVTIDGACLLPPRAGVARYLDGLLEGLRSIEGTEIEVVQPSSRRPMMRWVMWDLQRASSGFDLLHLPFYYPPAAPRCPVVVAVHDVLVLEHPEWFPRPWADVTARLIRRGVRRSAAVVTASEHVAERIVDRCGIPRNRIEVIPYGVSRSVFRPPASGEIRMVRGRFGLERPFVAQVGSFERRRGLDLTLEAVERLRFSHPELELVLIGEARSRVPDLEAPPAWVRRLGRVEDRFLPALLAGAEAVVAPSRDEGFDFPLLEALASGAAVVASDIGVHREHFSPAVALFATGRSDALAESLDTVLEGGAARLRSVAAGHAASFSWETAARRHRELWVRCL